MTVAEFIEARLSEDQVNADQALALWSDTHFTVDPGSLVIVRFHREHDPGRVLRQVAAMRAILAEHNAPLGYECNACESREWPCLTVRALTAIWSDHEGFRDEWRI